MTLARDSVSVAPARAALALAPALALIVVAVIVGPLSVAGLFALGFTVLVHSAMVVLVMPRLLRDATRVSEGDAALTRFLEQALGATTVDEIARDFVVAVHQALGPTEAFMLVPTAAGGVRLLPPAAAGAPMEGAEAAFLFLGSVSEDVDRADLAATQAEGAADALRLLDQVGGQRFLPMRHRGLLLGVGVIGRPTMVIERSAVFYRALRAYAAVAIANTYLDAERHAQPGVAANLGLANAVQESLMPSEQLVRRERFSLRGVFRPMAECGGDLWLWRELAGEKVLLVVADATGHGPAPALLAAVAKGAIDAQWQLFSGELDPGRLLTAVNRTVFRTGRRRYLMTAFAAVIDTVTGDVTFANAGQNFPMVLDRSSIGSLIARGNTLGSAGDAVYQTHRRKLTPGDRLLLFSDGLVDAGSPHREPFGERRLRAALSSHADLPLHKVTDLLLSRIEAHLEGRPLGDDLTAVIFELGGGAAA